MNSDEDHSHGSDRSADVSRRGLLGVLGGGLAAAATGQGVALPTATDGQLYDRHQSVANALDGIETSHTESHHPGPPRFLTVGEGVENPPHVGEFDAFDMRDNLSPWIPGATPDPDEYDPAAFEWRIVDHPDGSEATLEETTVTGDSPPRYEPGTEFTRNFVPDEPGRYVLELDAPDGTHEQSVHVFPGEGGPHPLLSLDGVYDEESDEFLVLADVSLAPDSEASRSDLRGAVLPDDRDGLAESDIELTGIAASETSHWYEEDDEGEQRELLARIPREAIDGESARVHAAVSDGHARSMMDTVTLQANGTISLPDRPPEWAREGVMYQIFTRSWAGKRGETTTQDLIDRMEYLDSLGIDMLWLTPVVPAESVTRQRGGDLLAPEYSHLANTLSGGGPHGYDTLDYFGISPDLVPEGEEPIEAFEAVIEAAHEYDIKVVFDVVISHCGRSNPLFQDTIANQESGRFDAVIEYPAVLDWEMDSRYFEWFARVDADDVYEGTVLEPAPHPTGFFGLRHMPNLNYDSLALREYILSVAEFWSGQVGVDGFRCDIAWGVPKSFWQELRAVVRGNNSETLLLDETIPKDPRMAESAFDMHFDTEGFTVAAHNVASGESSPGQLVDVVRDRRNQGVADQTLVLNLIENHDEHRLLNSAVIDLDNPDHDAVTDKEWEAGAKLQRACFTLSVLLPGVPGIYYGQERQISRFGEGRHLGDEDHRGRTNGGVDIQADVRPGGRQRAFMNWEEYPEEHLEFYRHLVEQYHALDALKPDATLRNVWSFSTDDVVVFGRDASHLDGVSGPERVLAVVNFEDGPAEVELRPEIGTEDLLTGEQFEDQVESRSGTVIEIDDLAVFEAPAFYSVGSTIAPFDPPEGTDHGPGEYEYPTGETFAEDSFDITKFTVGQRRESIQFQVGVGGSITNPDEQEHGFSHQFLQIYVRDPESEAGTTAGREGLEATFAAPYQYRILVDGEHGVRIEDAAGEEVSTGTVSVNTVTDELLIEVPENAFDRQIEQLELAPLLAAYDPDSPGNVRQVEETPTETAFGGRSAETPHVIDTGLPATFDNETALAATDGETAIPYAAVTTAFEEVASFDLETGTGYGPGSYQVPTGDDYYEEAWDIDALAIQESRDRVRFEFTMATEPENPWGFDPGFSHQFFQIYLHHPEGIGGSATGRAGTNVAFRAPHQYRVIAHGEGIERIEDGEGNTVSRDVDIWTEGRTISVEFPVAAVDWDTNDSGIAVSPFVAPFDGFGEGNLRAIADEAAEHTIGGGHVGDFDPAVMDMVVPDSLDREELLSAYDEETRPQLPYLGLGPAADITELAEVEGDTDESGDGETGEDETGEGETGEEGTDEEGETEGTETNGDGTATDTDDSDADSADDDGPGFGVGTALGTLGGSAYLLKRRLNAAEQSDD